MHLNSADKVVLQLFVQAPPHWKAMQNANRADVHPVIVKFRRIVKDQNSGIRDNESLVCGLEMSSKNVLFVHAVVGQKTIGCLGICPVLANQRNALTGALGELLEKFSESLVEPDVCELAANEFAFNPCLGLGGVACSTLSERCDSCRFVITAVHHGRAIRTATVSKVLHEFANRGYRPPLPLSHSGLVGN